jgi:hypothetical protein
MESTALLTGKTPCDTLERRFDNGVHPKVLIFPAVEGESCPYLRYFNKIGVFQ